MGTLDEKTLEVAALGRPFTLGMLYDCRSECLIPGITLWDGDELKNHIQTSDKSFSYADVLMSDTLEAKSNALDIKAELKVCTDYI